MSEIRGTINGTQALSGGLVERGNDGISPTVTVTDISGGHRITIKDIYGTKYVDILDGKNGEKGDQGIQGVQGVKGDKGDKGDTGATGAAGKDGITPHIGSNGNWWIGNTDTGVLAQGAVALARMAQVTLTASNWTGSDSLYSQVVTIAGVTAYSKVDLLPSVEQLAIFHNKDVAFVTENDNGVVTVYAIGDKPTQNYTMQVQITEVEV